MYIDLYSHLRYILLHLYVTATCPALSLSNGGVSYSSVRITFGSNNGRYYVDTKGTFNCYSGYSRSGPSSRTCTSSGTWNGHSPTCNKGNDKKLFIDFNVKKDKMYSW